MQALFNQDNGTGRIAEHVGRRSAGRRRAHAGSGSPSCRRNSRQQIRYSGVGAPATGGTDNASFDCYGAPAFGLSSLGWDYGTYTHHTNRDSFDKIVFDDLKGNATIIAMLAYLASEDPTFITRERADLTAEAAAVAVAAVVDAAHRAARGAEHCALGRSRWRRLAVAAVAATTSTTRAGRRTCPKAPRFYERHVARHGAVEAPVSASGRDRWQPALDAVAASRSRART